MEKRITLLIALLLFSLIAETAFFNVENAGLREEVNNLQIQADMLNAQLANISSSVNLVANVTVTDKLSFDGISVVEIRGAIRNFGSQTAYHTGLQIVAFNMNRALMTMNISASVGTYNFDLDKGTVGYLRAMREVYFSQPNVEPTGHIDGYSSQNIYANIYHASIFPNGTVFKVVPIWSTAS